MSHDWHLLETYARSRQPDVFAQLVRLHLDFVHASARRMTSSAAADDITQAVFILLEKHARKIPQRGTLAGWLYRTTRFCANNWKKTEARRQKREQVAATMRPAFFSPSSHSDIILDLAPALDDALAKLPSTDRQAVILSHLHGKNLHQTSSALGLSPDAVRKRLSRALVHMRSSLTRAGWAVPSVAVLVALMAREASAHAPASLASGLAASVTHGTTSSALELLVRSVSKKLWWTPAKITAISSALAACLFLALGLHFALRSLPPISKALPAPIAAQPQDSFPASLSSYPKDSRASIIGEVYVTGRVTRPGAYPLSSSLTLRQLVISAGIDLTMINPEDTVLLTRKPADAPESSRIINLAQLVTSTDVDLPLAPNDLITVASR